MKKIKDLIVFVILFSLIISGLVIFKRVQESKQKTHLEEGLILDNPPQDWEVINIKDGGAYIDTDTLPGTISFMVNNTTKLMLSTITLKGDSITYHFTAPDNYTCKAKGLDITCIKNPQNMTTRSGDRTLNITNSVKDPNSPF